MREKLERLLAIRNMKPASFARMIGVKTSTIDDIIKGKTNELNIGVDKVLRIAKGLGISVEELYDEAPTKVSAEEAHLIDLWRGATPDGKKASLSVLEVLQTPKSQRQEDQYLIAARGGRDVIDISDPDQRNQIDGLYGAIEAQKKDGQGKK